MLFFVVVEPISLVPLFAALTEGADDAFRRRMALKAVLLSGTMFLLFAVGGTWFLRVMGISIEAFRIAGGIMLFLIALGDECSRGNPARARHRRSASRPRNARTSPVFPLAFPFISGPGALAIVLLTFGASRGDFALSAGLFGVIVVVLAITYILMRLTPLVMRAMGVTGANVVNRALGRRACGARGAVRDRRSGLGLAARNRRDWRVDGESSFAFRTISDEARLAPQRVEVRIVVEPDQPSRRRLVDDARQLRSRAGIATSPMTRERADEVEVQDGVVRVDQRAALDPLFRCAPASPRICKQPRSITQRAAVVRFGGDHAFDPRPARRFAASRAPAQSPFAA